jgi:hypothetical protein
VYGFGQGALHTQAGRRSGVLAALAWINPRFSAFLAHRSWSARSEERVGGVAVILLEISTHNPRVGAQDMSQ